jgi:hypothetical protein
MLTVVFVLTGMFVGVQLSNQLGHLAPEGVARDVVFDGLVPAIAGGVAGYYLRKKI